MANDDLRRVVWNSVNVTNLNGKWKEPFNQASFFNYDTTNIVKVNDFIIPPAVSVGGNTYPTVLEYNLNTMEVNVTYFTFSFPTPATANLQIIYSQYEGIGVGEI